jgi:type III secretory pathway component EscV
MIHQVQSCLNFPLVLTMIEVLNFPSVLTIALHKAVAQNTPEYLTMQELKHMLQQ